MRAKLTRQSQACSEAAIGLYHKAGFTEMGVRKNYYPSADGKEDALLMGKVLFDPELMGH
ncbi:hypothetical protein [Pseudoalteromonas rubra]|uniref:hypothetical protein n=1 Tax=Pseudoalteromonas rubra TaxID=43658 RepID=UPI003D347611